MPHTLPALGHAHDALAPHIEALAMEIRHPTYLNNLKRFGRRWAWLSVAGDGQLLVQSSANQDRPLMAGWLSGSAPIPGLDAGEHADDLQYQNRRPECIQARAQG